MNITLVVPDGWAVDIQNRAGPVVIPDPVKPPPVVVPPGTSALRTLLASLAPDSFGLLPTTGFDAALGNTGGGSRCIIPFAGRVPFSVKRRRIVVIAGDHGGIARYVELDEETSTWLTVGDPTKASHGYQETTVDPSTDVIYHRVGISAVDQNAHPDWTEFCAGAPGSNDWQQVLPRDAGMNLIRGYPGMYAVDFWDGPFPGSAGKGVVVVSFLYAGGSVSFYDPALRAWLPGVTPVWKNNGQYHQQTAYSKRANALVMGFGNDSQNNMPLTMLRLNADRTVTQLPDAPFPMGIYWGSKMSPAPNGNILVLGRGQHWELDATGAGKWTRLGDPPKTMLDPGVPGNNTISCALPECVVYVEAKYDIAPVVNNVWVYRPA